MHSSGATISDAKISLYEKGVDCKRDGYPWGSFWVKLQPRVL